MFMGYMGTMHFNIWRDSNRMVKRQFHTRSSVNALLQLLTSQLLLHQFVCFLSGSERFYPLLLTFALSGYLWILRFYWANMATMDAIATDTSLPADMGKQLKKA